jgi:DHA3 family macrolide efflux protein-like MFS transporter
VSRLRAFLIIWTGQAFSLLGSELAQFALIWWLTRTTNSPTVLALASMVGLLPQVVFGPIVGVLVDRWSRRAVMLAADTLVALSTLYLGYLFWTDAASIAAVFVVLFLRALGSTFHWPAMQASTTLMVPDRHLTRIQGMNQAMNGGLRIVAAPMGALLLEWIDVAGIIALDVGTALLAIVPLLFIPIPRPQRAPSASRGLAAIWQELGEGLQHVRARPALLIIMGQALLINLVLTPAFALLPILVTNHFRGEALQLAWLQAGFSAGLVGGGLLLGVWGGFRRRIHTTLFGLMGMGVGLLVVALTPATLLPVAAGGLVIVGAMLSLTNGPVHAILQATVAPEMQGRVFMLLRSLATLVAPLGLTFAGPISELVGVRFWFFAGGVVTLVTAVAGSFSRVLLAVEDSPARARVTARTSAD